MVGSDLHDRRVLHSLSDPRLHAPPGGCSTPPKTLSSPDPGKIHNEETGTKDVCGMIHPARLRQAIAGCRMKLCESWLSEASGSSHKRCMVCCPMRCRRVHRHSIGQDKTSWVIADWIVRGASTKQALHPPVLLHLSPLTCEIFDSARTKVNDSFALRNVDG
jgi:hypothetical protein